MSDFVTHKVLAAAQRASLLVEKQAVPGEADPSANKLFAMKVLKDTRQEGDENWRERMWTERNILANIDHPFLTRLRYAFETRGVFTLSRTSTRVVSSSSIFQDAPA